MIAKYQPTTSEGSGSEEPERGGGGGKGELGELGKFYCDTAKSSNPLPQTKNNGRSLRCKRDGRLAWIMDEMVLVLIKCLVPV